MDEPRPSPGRIGAIDGFRAYAILGVVTMHLLGISGALRAIQGTAAGLAVWSVLGNVIDAFFIISGFVLFLPIVRRGGLGDVRAYVVGRAARILPAYWLSLAAVLVLIPLVPTAFAPAFPGASDIVVHLLVLQQPMRMIDPGLAVGFGLDGPLWMLSILVGFYVVLPFVARPYLRHPLLGLALAAAVTLGWKEAALHLPSVFAALAGGSFPSSSVSLMASGQLPGWSFSFALGMTAAWAYVIVPTERLQTFVRGRAAVTATIVAYVTCAVLYAHTAYAVGGPEAGTSARADPVLAMASSVSRAAMMALIALGPLWAQRPFANRFTARLADLSYGVYLIHLVVAICLAQLLGLALDGHAGTVAIWFAVVLPPSFAYAYLSLVLVERPTRRWALARERRGDAHGERVPPGAVGAAARAGP